MNYTDMSRAQKQNAQALLQRLREHGVMESVSQVAAHYEAACAWGGGTMTLATLLDRTGWKRTAPVEQIHRAELPTGVLRHVRAVLSQDGTPASQEALELLPEV